MALYESYLTHLTATTLADVHAAASRLVNQFQAANRRAGGQRINPSMGPLASGVVPAPAPLTEQTGERMAVALERLVSLLAGHLGQPDPYADLSDSSDESGGDDDGSDDA